MKSVPLSIFLLFASAAPIEAAGVNFAWDACLGDAGAVSLKQFACDRNTGQDALYASFVPAVSFAVATLLEVAIDVRTRSGMPLSVWWDVSDPGCRRDQLGADPVQPSSTPTCAGWIASPFFSTARFNFRYPTPDGARLVVSTQTVPASVTAGIQYIGCRILLRHPATVGVSTCGGCLDPVDVTLTAVRLAKVGSELLITQPQTSNLVHWQQDQPVHASRTTWGAVKALYR